MANGNRNLGEEFHRFILQNPGRANPLGTEFHRFILENIPLNQNIKRVGADGSIDLHDDSALLQPLVEAALTGTPTPLQPKGIRTAEPPRQTQPLQEATPVQPVQEGGGGQNPLAGPLLPFLLGNLAQAVTGRDPTAWQNILGRFASGFAQNQIFQNYLNQLNQNAVGGVSEQGPNVAATSLSPLEVAALTPEMQLAAMQAAQQSEALQLRGQEAALRQALGMRRLQSMDVEDVYTLARTQALLSPKAEKGDFEIVDLGWDPDGRLLSGGRSWRYRVNMQTGDVSPVGPGKTPEPRREGGGADPTVQNRLWFNTFDRMAKEAVSRAGFGELVQNLDGSTTFKFTNPEEGGKLYRKEFNRLLAEGSAQGLVPPNFSRFVPQNIPEETASKLKTVRSRADFEALDVGEKFNLEDGRIGIKRSDTSLDILE